MSDRPRVYLAGPEVFLPDAVEVGKRKCAICDELGLRGLYPLDNEAQGSPLSIYGGNTRYMDAADAIVANLTPFRGPSADVGTAFEVGYMAARGKLVFAYTNRSGGYHERVLDMLGGDADASTDPSGMTIESFGLFDNLMLECSVRTSGGIVVQSGDVHRDAKEAIGDLSAFQECVTSLSRLLEVTR